jgi:glycosyltransferase involved in cell wall biosynthesis
MPEREVVGETAARRLVWIIAENVREPAQEGYDIVVLELRRALARRVAVCLHVTHAPKLPSLAGIARAVALLDPGLSRRIRRQKPDLLIYASQSSATMFALLRARLLKIRSGGAPVAILALQEWNLDRMARLARHVLPDLLLVATRAQLTAAVRLGARAHLISSGVDLTRFRPATAGEKDALRRRIDLDRHGPVLLHVGHLTPGRNLEALARLAGSGRYQVLFVASSLPDSSTEDLLRRLNEAGVRVVRGYQHRIEDYYRLADCYVFPTVSSANAINFPLSVLEAMACDTPVATTRFGALPEHFTGSPGVYFANNPDDMEAAVVEGLRGGGGTRALAERYSWDNLATTILEAEALPRKSPENRAPSR